jgi:hypothetical protein
MRDARPARLTMALAGAGVSWDQVTDCRSLPGGTRLVVKIPPGPPAPILRYERGILGTSSPGQVCTPS